MRAAIIGLAALGLVTNAFAADLDDDSFIRGSDDYVPAPTTHYNWQGFYAGGQIGVGTSRVAFGNGVSSLVAFILRDTAEEATFHPSTWTTLSDQSTSGQSYGVFGGYNWQWEDVILGLELNYNRTSLKAQDGSSMSRFGPLAGLTTNITVTANASMSISDYGALRGRFGYVFGRFMPYGTLGVVVGRATVTQFANVTEIFTDANGNPVPGIGFPPPGQSMTQSKVAYPWGFQVGAGMDVALMPGLFLRGEYEFTQFGTFNDMRADIQTVRVGAAVKF